jgi:hypothetical protein
MRLQLADEGWRRPEWWMLPILVWRAGRRLRRALRTPPPTHPAVLRVLLSRARPSGTPALVLELPGPLEQGPRQVRFCSIAGCERERRGQGLCKPHLERLKRYGSPLAGPPIGADGDPDPEHFREWLQQWRGKYLVVVS